MSYFGTIYGDWTNYDSGGDRMQYRVFGFGVTIWSYMA